MTLKKRLFLVGILLALAGLFSCVFDETEDAKSWMAHSGVPVSTKIDMVLLDGVKPDSLWIVQDTLPYVNQYTISLGEVNGVRQEMVMDLLTQNGDSSALEWLQEGDSSWVALSVNLDSAYYATMPQGDSLPFEEGLTARFAWKLYTQMDGDAIDSLVPGNNDMDTLLMKVMAGDEKWDTASTPLVVKFSKVGNATTIPLPQQLQSAFQKAKKGHFYLQMKVAFERAERVYRLSGDNSKAKWRPRLSFSRVKNDSTQTYSGLIDSIGVYSRYFQVGYVYEEAKASQLTLHGGVPESLYVDFPEELVFSEIQRQLQDSFALRNDQIDSLLTDRFVLLASMDLASDKDKKHSELGRPLLVYSYSVVDTIDAAGVIGFTEEYNSSHEPRTLIDSLNVVTKGRANTLFWSKRDSVQMQITNAVRYWLQSKNYGAHLRAKMAVSAWPIFEPDRYSTSSYYDADSNEVDVVSSFAANSRWTLGNSDSLTFRIRMWLTEKR